MQIIQQIALAVFIDLNPVVNMRKQGDNTKLYLTESLDSFIFKA